MSGDLLALGAAAALALAGAARRGSRARVEDRIERPKVLWDVWPAHMKKALGEAAKTYHQTMSSGLPIPHNLARDLALRAYRDQVLPLGDSSATSSFFLGSMFDYLVAGTNNFVVGPELQSQLLQTSLTRLKRWMIKPPYGAFYIALPESPYAIWGTEPELAPVRGVIVDTTWRMGELALLIWAPTTNLRSALDRIRDDEKLQGIPQALLRDHFGWIGNDSYVAFNIDEALAYSGGIEAYLDDRWSEVSARFVAEKGWPAEAAAKTAEARLAVLKIALGTILYLQSDKAELSVDAITAHAAAKRKKFEAEAAGKSGRKAKRLLDKAAKLSGSITTWLGKSIEAEGAATRAAIREGRRPPRRHWVRGHWKVPYAKHKARVITWIMPYEKGKERQQRITGRTYRFDGDKS